jgi:hypothetical protein
MTNAAGGTMRITSAAGHIHQLLQSMGLSVLLIE